MAQQIADSELELMKIIWARGGTALYAELMEELMARGCAWQKNTVITLLSRLVEKGLLGTSKIGRRNRYTALVSEGDYQAAQAKTLLDKLYQGSARGLVSTLIQSDLLTPRDFEELKKILDEGSEAR